MHYTCIYIPTDVHQHTPTHVYAPTTYKYMCPYRHIIDDHTKKVRQTTTFNYIVS